jgi:hypothetical protein
MAQLAANGGGADRHRAIDVPGFHAAAVHRRDQSAAEHRRMPLRGGWCVDERENVVRSKIAATTCGFANAHLASLRYAP